MTEKPETQEVAVRIFKCDHCGTKAVPVDGYGTLCHKRQCDGHFNEKTAETMTVELTDAQVEHYADTVIID